MNSWQFKPYLEEEHVFDNHLYSIKKVLIKKKQILSECGGVKGIRSLEIIFLIKKHTRK